MSTIEISDLCPLGAELFSDNENYMGELTASEFTNVKGGTTPGILSFIGVSSAACGGVISAVGSTIAYTIWGNKK